jgi:erythritol kinase
MRDLLIGVDAGTSVIKSIAFDMGGRQVAAAMVPNSYRTLPDGGVEQDPARTWRDMAETLRLLAGQIPDLASRTAAVSITGQGDGTWLIDSAGEPVGQAWLWLDARATSIVEEMRARPEDRVRFERTGTGLAACQQGPQLAYMKANMPDMMKRATTAFHCKDWLYFKMTGERVTDLAEGMFTFGDFRTRAYSDEVIGALGLSDLRRLLPPMIDSTTHWCGLTAAAAEATGLMPGTPVVLAGLDVICTAIGAGLIDGESRPGCSVIGSTGMHMRLAETVADIKLNDARTGYTMPLPVPGMYTQLHSNMAATLNIDWVLGLARDILASQGVTSGSKEMIPLIDRWIDAAQPGSLLYQPFVSEAGERGPFVDANARAGFIGISSRHGYADLVRAVFEGLAFAARDCYAAMGPLPSEVRLTGGAARSAALRRILGAALGAKVRTSAREEAGAAGAAMIGAQAIGLYPSMTDCVAEWTTPLLGEAEIPDAGLAETYDRLFHVYADAHAALRPIWRSLAGLRHH